MGLSKKKKKKKIVKKKIQNGRLKKKLIFQLCQFSIFFHENLMDWSFGLVGLIDAKGMGWRHFVNNDISWTLFFKIINPQNNFVEISRIGPWVSRID